MTGAVSKIRALVVATLVVGSALAATAALGGTAAADAAANTETLTVASDGSAEYTSIQSAVRDADAGDRIAVQGGTYDEQIVVEKNLTIAGSDGATIAYTSSPGSSYAANSFMIVRNDASVDLQGLAFEGPFTSANAAGLFVTENATVDADSVTMSQMFVPDSDGEPSGVQYHGAIALGHKRYTDSTDYGTIQLSNSHIDEFGKFAVLSSGDGSNATVTGTDINGSGDIDTLAQDAVLVDGGDAVVENSSFRDIRSTGDTGTGITVYGPSDTVELRDSSFDGVNKPVSLQSFRAFDDTTGVVDGVIVTNNTIRNQFQAVDVFSERSLAGTDDTVVRDLTFTENDIRNGNTGLAAWTGNVVDSRIANNVLANNQIQVYQPRGTFDGAGVLAENDLDRAVYVGQPNSTIYSGIQAAIDGAVYDEAAAQDGETVTVHPGTYDESVTVDVTGVTVAGPNAGTSGAGDRDAEATIQGQVVINADGVVFDGFDVTPPNATSNPSAEALRVSGSADDVVVRNNVVRDFGEDSVGKWEGVDGIVAFGGDENDAVSNVTIADNKVSTITGRDTAGGVTGISIQGNVAGATVTDNVVTDIGMNETAWAFGLVVRGTGNHPQVPTDIELQRNDVTRVFSNPNTDTVGVGVGVEADASELTVRRNAVTNVELLVENKDTNNALDVTRNWWGNASGPDTGENPKRTDAATIGGAGDVTYTPWLDAPADEGGQPTAPVENVDQGTYHLSIRGAVDAANPDERIEVSAGTYDESVTVSTENLTVAGTGDVSVVGDGSGTGFQVDADGTTIRNVTVSQFGNGVKTTDAISDLTLRHVDVGASTYGVHVNAGSVDGLTFDDVTVADANNGLRVGSDASVTGLTVTGDSAFVRNDIGVYFAHPQPDDGDVSDVLVEETAFVDNANKAIYTETLDGATFDGVVVDGGGAEGFDINLKAGNYGDITVENSVFNDTSEAIKVKEYDGAGGDAGATNYAVGSVSVDNVTVQHSGAALWAYGYNQTDLALTVERSTFQHNDYHLLVDPVAIGASDLTSIVENPTNTFARASLAESQPGVVYSGFERAFEQDEVADGDTVRVYNGTYDGGVTLDTPATVRAAEGEYPVIDGSDLGPGGGIDPTVVQITAPDVTVEGFEIVGGDGTGTGVSVQVNKADSGVVVRNNYIHGIAGQGGGDTKESFGVLAWGTDTTLQNITITGNVIADIGSDETTSQGFGIFLEELADAEQGYDGATIENNAVRDIAGTTIDGDSYPGVGVGILPELTNPDNSVDDGGIVSDTANAAIRNNGFEGATVGVSVAGDVSQLTVDGNDLAGTEIGVLTRGNVPTQGSIGVTNLDASPESAVTDGPVDATNNWWGDADGPGADAVAGAVDATPFLTSPPGVFFDAGVRVSDDEVPNGAAVTVEATVENTGTRTYTQDVVFEVDGDRVATETVELAGGESETLNVEYQPGSIGTRNVDVSTADDTASASISVTRAPSNDPTRPDGSDDSDTDDETDTGDETVAENETTAGNETVAENETTADNETDTDDGNETDADDTEIDAEPDTVEEATVENSTAEFDEADQVEEVAFETEEVNTTVEVEEYDDPPENVTEEVSEAVTDTDTGDDGGDADGGDADDGDAGDGDTGDDVEADVVSVVDISPTSEEAENASATVELTVDSDELANPENAVVTHETADGWEELETTVEATSDGEVTLAAEADSFSLFAVVEVESTAETTEQTTTTTTTAETTATTADDTTADSSTDPSTDESADGSSDGGGLPGFTATAAILALAGTLVALRRREA